MTANRTYSLTDAGLDDVRASAAFNGLPDDQRDMLEESLQTALGGMNAASARQLRQRLNHILAQLDPGAEAGLRATIMAAIQPRA